MKHLLSILAALCVLAAPAAAQTIRTIGYNSTNGQVVANTGTNTLTFTNSVRFGADVSFGTNASAVTRTNLGIPLAALTNTSNVTVIRALAGTTNSNHPFSGQFNVIDDNSITFTIVVSNGIIVSATEY